MINSKDAVTSIARALFCASLVAWIMIAAAPHLSSDPTALICGSRWARDFTPGWLWSAGVDSALMIVAMMAPMTLQPLCHIRVSAFSDRLWRSAALFMIGYATLWFLACFAMRACEALLNRGINDARLQFGLVAMIAIVWQVSPMKQRCLNQCHYHPALAAFGWKADLDVLRFGVQHGVWCIGSCWALMLFVESVSQWHFVGMGAVALIMFCERLEPPMRPVWRWPSFRMASLHLGHAWSVKRMGWLAPRHERSS
jgi:predicted metal-binding membrane protein